ncbi:hypothetical protein LINPERPRIM_LOCUS31351 [Linum perenne]
MREELKMSLKIVLDNDDSRTIAIYYPEPSSKCKIISVWTAMAATSVPSLCWGFDV